MKTLLVTLDISFRIIILIIAVSLGVMFLFAGAKAALAANLKYTSIITNDTLTLGDLFDGLAAEKASYVLGPAPLPGQDMVLNARTLMRIATALDMSWRPHSTADQVRIRRAATLIPAAAIENKISARLRKNGLEGRFDITFGGIGPEIILPADQPADFEIADLHFDTQNNRFEAKLLAPSKENAIKQMLVTGTVIRLTSVPVLKKTRRAGDIINLHDIEWIDLQDRTVQHDIILKTDDMIGMTPRRSVSAGKPVRSNDLEYPEMVSRGKIVTIVYNNGPLILTSKGKALQSGARGDLIRVVNVASNRSIQAIVSADHEVTVSP